MAGRGRYIYIQDDVDVRLQKENNKSLLVNNLLREYFDKDDIMQMDAEQLEKELKIREIEREHKKKIKELRNGR